MESEPLGKVPFQEHIELLEAFLARRDEIIERLQGVLNAQRRPIEHLQDRAALSRQLEDCFFSLPGIPGERMLPRSQLEDAHWASGFRPRRMPGVPNDLVDAPEMMMRGFHLWRQTRWPGRNGRVRYAHTLFSLYLLRRLELLAMRLWDAGSTDAPARLAQIQRVLDRLRRTNPPDAPVFVRDARWLIPLAQSPTTDELAPYFDVARRIAESLPEADRIEISKACVQTAGGHLRSQLRHCSMEKGVSIDDHEITLSTRNSNALDFAMLIQGLVPLLEAYERARLNGEVRRRLELASAICQGISADPELFVNRLELLAAYSMIEYLFVAVDGEGRARYTPMGQRHVELLERYAAHIERASPALHEDCVRFAPVAGAYSPYGVIYGFSSNLIEHMALKTLQPDAVTGFSVEDVFADGDHGAEKLAWVSGWRKLPHIGAHVQKLFEYPQRFAEDMFNRVERAFRRRASDSEAHAATPTGRLHVRAADDPQTDSTAWPITDLPIRYIGSSDLQMQAANKAHAYDEKRLLLDRREGMFLISYPTAGGWTAITKDVLTEVLGAGRDARIVGLPREAAGVLRLMCRHLLAEPIGACFPLAEQSPHDECSRNDDRGQSDRRLHREAAAAQVQPNGCNIDGARDEQ